MRGCRECSRHVRDGLWVGVAAAVAGLPGAGSTILLDALGRRLDGLVLRADLGKKERAMLADGRLDGGGKLNVGGVRRRLLGVHGHLRGERISAAVSRLVAGLLEGELIGIVGRGSRPEGEVVVEGHIDGHVGSGGELDVGDSDVIRHYRLRQVGRCV